MLIDPAVYEGVNKAHLKLLLEEQAEIQTQIKKTEEDWLNKNEKLR